MARHRVFPLPCVLFTLAASPGCSGADTAELRHDEQRDASSGVDGGGEAVDDGEREPPASDAGMDAAPPDDATVGPPPPDASEPDAAPQDDAAVPIQTDFAQGFEGWTAVDLAGRDEANASYATVLEVLDDLTWQATGGQEGGYLSRLDTTSYSFFFEAPAALLGDLSAYAGGSLDFYLKATHASWLADAVVVLVTANDAVIVHAITAPGTDWTSYSIHLAAENFQYDDNQGAVVSEADFAAALSDVRALRFPGEWGAAVEETVGFDSVELKVASTAH